MFNAFMYKAIAILILLCLASYGSAQTTSKSTHAVPVGTAGDYFLLPPFISGWEKDSSMPALRYSDAAAVDSSRVALLKELGFTDAETAAYQRQGRKVIVKAWRFADATGAFGAYSALQQPNMAPEKFGDRAVSKGKHILILRSNVVLQVDYDKITAMTPAEMRSLAALIAPASGPAGLAPTAPLYLPKTGISAIHFALGPAGLQHTGAPLPAEVIDFSKGAEVVVGELAEEDGSLITIIRYPTFALAADRQKTFAEWAKARPAIPAVDAGPLQLATFYTRRIGPLVIVVTGKIAEARARALAEQVPYDVEITQNEPAPTQKDNIGNLVVNMLYLSFIIVGFTFVTGVAYGGLRILSRKFFPGRFIDRPENVDFIKLDLHD